MPTERRYLTNVTLEQFMRAIKDIYAHQWPSISTTIQFWQSSDIKFPCPKVIPKSLEALYGQLYLNNGLSGLHSIVTQFGAELREEGYLTTVLNETLLERALGHATGSLNEFVIDFRSPTGKYGESMEEKTALLCDTYLPQLPGIIRI